jgi:hypothetical protein
MTSDKRQHSPNPIFFLAISACGFAVSNAGSRATVIFSSLNKIPSYSDYTECLYDFCNFVLLGHIQPDIFKTHYNMAELCAIDSMLTVGYYRLTMTTELTATLNTCPDD